MKEITPKDSRYVPLTQQKSCCASTCILMVMYKQGIPLLPQELLGYHLGLIVSEEYKKLFWNVRTGEKPPSGYGTRLFTKKYNPDRIFKKLGIPLKIKNHLINQFKSLEKFSNFITDCVKKDKDILACFNSGTLNNDKNKKSGHLCVIDQVYPSKGMVRLIDPSPTQAKWRMVKIESLKKAMENHPNNSGGIWEVYKTPRE